MYAGSEVRVASAFPALLVAIGVLVAVPGSIQAGEPVGSCLCCWEQFNPWPMLQHVTEDTGGTGMCEFKNGDWWVQYGHGEHDDPMDGSCENGTYHGPCGGGGENFTLAMEFAREGDAEGLIPMLDSDGGYVRMALDGTGIQVLTCDLSRVAAWVPLTSDGAELVARRGAIQRETLSSAEE